MVRMRMTLIDTLQDWRRQLDYQVTCSEALALQAERGTGMDSEKSVRA